MFNTLAYAAIDTIQTSKKQMVNLLVTHQGLNKALNDFVDTQTEYAKGVFDAGITMALSVGSIVSNKKFVEDYYNSVMQQSTNLMNIMLGSKK